MIIFFLVYKNEYLNCYFGYCSKPVDLFISKKKSPSRRPSISSSVLSNQGFFGGTGGDSCVSFSRIVGRRGGSFGACETYKIITSWHSERVIDFEYQRITLCISILNNYILSFSILIKFK